MATLILVVRVLIGAAPAVLLDGMTRLRPRSQVDVGCRSGEVFRLSGRATVAGGLSENPAYECWS